MADLEIVCVNRESKSKRIEEVGIRLLNSKEPPRAISVQDAIALRGQGHKLWVNQGGKPVVVDEMKTHHGKFLRTHPNGIVDDNLIHLPTCPSLLKAQSTGNSSDDFLKDL
ncbi:hypothetical protein predicted by Glimmer/Critica [Sorangium cellulosum So ce56]|uniref:DUF3892 domain-containing protein n=1 Tax=Sorangium cellulosum (strain So ce56) TaxID=448385 RepID=A9GPR2_SORC5|nr:DUF3892 domain-containing protein [Sorangium cellulosum]CAN96794.1 hypothetical protein predicted by Glimmer/Critica [Sorangium cellulosum So ce56]